MTTHAALPNPFSGLVSVRGFEDVRFTMLPMRKQHAVLERPTLDGGE